MDYISTRNNKEIYSFEKVFIKGLADDGGLFVPKEIKKLSNEEFSKLKNLSYNQLATEIISKFTGDFIAYNELYSLIQKSYTSFRDKNVVKFKD